eukprot:g11288.t1
MFRQFVSYSNSSIVDKTIQNSSLKVSKNSQTKNCLYTQDVVKRFEEYVNAKHVYESLRYLSILEKQNLVESRHYLYIIDKCNLSSSANALSLLERMRTHYGGDGDGKILSAEVYNLVLKRTCFTSDEMWNIMLQYGINGLDPDEDTYTTLLKLLIVEGDFKHANQVYEKIPLDIASKLPLEIKIIMNEEGTLSFRNVLLNEFRHDYFDEAIAAGNRAAARRFALLLGSKDLLDDAFYKKIYENRYLLQIWSKDIESIAFTTSQYYSTLYEDLLYSLMLEGNIEGVEKVVESEALRIIFEKNADMVQYYLNLDNDRQVALRETELVRAWKRGDLSYAEELLEKMEENGVAHSKLYNLKLRQCLSLDEMLELLNNWKKRQIDLNGMHDHYGESYSFHVSIAPSSTCTTNDLSTAVLRGSSGLVNLHELLIKQALLEGNYSKAQSLCKDGIEDEGVRNAFLTYISGHKNSYSKNEHFRSDKLMERLNHLHKCIKRDKEERLQYCQKVYESKETQLHKTYLKNAMFFLETLKDNCVADLPTLYDSLICDYGVEMFDSYELEKYIGKIGEQWHTISQLNILFEKFIIDKRYKEAIRTLSSMVSLEPKVSSSNRSQIDPNSRTLAIFCAEGMPDDWLEFIQQDQEAATALSALKNKVESINAIGISETSKDTEKIFRKEEYFKHISRKPTLMTEEDGRWLSGTYDKILDELSISGDLRLDHYMHYLYRCNHSISSNDMENVLMHMFSQGYDVWNQVYEQLYTRYVREGRFADAKNCVNLMSKNSARYELKWTKKLSKYADWTNAIIDRKNWWIRPNKRGKLYKHRQWMLSLRLAKLNHAMLHNDMDQHSVQACLLDLNDDPYREYLDHRSFWDYYKRVARNKRCTLEILDTLIHDNQTNENYARTNNVMPIKGPRSIRDLYKTFIQAQLDDNKVDQAEETVLKLFCRTTSERDRQDFFDSIATVFSQEILFVPTDFFSVQRIGDDVLIDTFLMEAQKDHNVSIQPLFGEISCPQNYIGAGDTFENALEQLKCTHCYKFGHDKSRCPLLVGSGGENDLIEERDRRIIQMDLPLLNRYVYDAEDIDAMEANDNPSQRLPLKITGGFVNVKKVVQMLNVKTGSECVTRSHRNVL